MKNIGIVGVTAEGAALCYRTIVFESEKTFGKNIHPEISLHTYSHNRIVELENKKDYDAVAGILLSSIEKLATIGADFIIIPSNSAHYSIRKVQKLSPLPILSIVDITVLECIKNGYKRIGILGIEETMSDGLYEIPIKQKGLEAIIPTKEEQAIVNRVLWENVIPGNPTSETTEEVVEVIKQLKQRGCEVVILGCTELPIIITQENSPLPFVDTTRLLAKKAVEKASQAKDKSHLYKANIVY